MKCYIICAPFIQAIIAIGTVTAGTAFAASVAVGGAVNAAMFLIEPPRFHWPAVDDFWADYDKRQ